VVAVHDRAASPRAMIALYLAAIVAANLLVARFGPRAAFAVAFAFIGLDLTVRDRLHETWMRRGLVWKMSLLIASGSAISWLLNRGTGRVALASFVAFAAASICDALSFHLLRERRYLVKVNGSNVFGALADSIVFPTIAFGAFAFAITAGQFISKVAGGFVWSLLIGAPKPEPGLPPAAPDG
jgi:hypothetical protein